MPDLAQASSLSPPGAPETPMAPMDQDNYAALSIKTMSSSLPQQYFYNATTGEVSWQRPEALPAPPAVPGAETSDAGATGAANALAQAESGTAAKAGVAAPAGDADAAAPAGDADAAVPAGSEEEAAPDMPLDFDQAAEEAK